MSSSTLDPLTFFDAAPRLDAIAPALIERERWQCFRAVIETDKQGKQRVTKPPHNPRTGRECNAHDPQNWTSLIEAWEALQKHGMDGIGFLPGDGIAAIDIDGCRAPDSGAIQPWASEIVQQLPGGYWEISPSSTGLRGFFFWNGEPLASKKFGNVEFHFGPLEDGKPSGNYVTVTGRRLSISTDDLTDATDAITRLYAELRAKRTERQTGQTQKEIATRQEPRATVSTHNLTDAELLDKARRDTKTGAKFTDLYDCGAWRNYPEYPSQSEADLFVMRRLAFWTAKDAARMDRLFRASALMRGKWDSHPTYAPDTIDLAISSCDAVYDPNYRSGRPALGTAPTAPEIQNTCTNICTSESTDDDTDLPDNLPIEASPTVETGLDWNEWKKATDRLARWKERQDLAFKWASGDHWNAARADISHGEKGKYLRKKFGDAARHIQNYAVIAARITDPVERRRVSAWWVYRELGNVEPDKRDEVYRTYQQRMQDAKEGKGTALNSAELKAMLGIVKEECPDKPQEWWQFLRTNPQGKNLGQLLAKMIDQSERGDAEAHRTLEYITQALSGRLWDGENAPAKFHPSVKNETAENADFEIETASIRAYKDDTFSEEETQDFSTQDFQRVSATEEADFPVVSPSPPSVSVNTERAENGQEDSEAFSLHGLTIPQEEEEEYIDLCDLPDYTEIAAPPVLRLVDTEADTPHQHRLNALRAFVDGVMEGRIPTGMLRTQGGAQVSPGWVRSLYKLAADNDTNALDYLEFVAAQARSAPPPMEVWAMQGGGQ